MVPTPVTIFGRGLFKSRSGPALIRINRTVPLVRCTHTISSFFTFSHIFFAIFLFIERSD